MAELDERLRRRRVRVVHRPLDHVASLARHLTDANIADRVNGMKVLFIGDVVGGPGRRGLAAAMPALHERHAPDLVVVNGENSAGGMGITEKTAAALFEAGAGRDHHRQPRLPPPRRLRLPRSRATESCGRPTTRYANPGRGYTVVEAAGQARRRDQPQRRRSGCNVARSPFHEVDSILEKIECDFAIVDFHAEVTSEKVAMGWHLDGRVAAVLGTHTHVPTADARVLPRGTAFISDVGMTGSRTSVLGVKPELILESMITQMPVKFETAEEDVWVMGAVVEVNERGLADSIEQVMVPAPT